MNFLGPSPKAPLGILTLVNGKRNDELVAARDPASCEAPSAMTEYSKTPARRAIAR